MNLSGAVQAAGIDRPGINLGGIAGYGSQQLLRSLTYAGGGSFPGTYAATTYTCSQGGSNTTTTWYNNITNSSGYQANFWAGATFVAINTGTGTSYGAGTITASTANTGGSGITFSLSPAISSACNPNQNDVLIVRLNRQNTLISPSQLLDGHVCSTATWNTTDTSPASTNTQQSLQMPNGCFLNSFADAIIGNRTNSNGQAALPVNFINLNGSYNATFKAKCASAGCSINFNFGRSGGITYLSSSTVNPTYSASQGAGWTTYSYPFNAVETGPPGQNLLFGFTCTGNCLLQDVDVIEASTLPGNTTVFRDAVVYELQKLHPGSIRYMDPSQWCSDVADEIAATGNRRWCGVNPGAPGSIGQAIGYNDVLALANLVGADAMISVGALNQPADWTTLIAWLNSSGWISTYAASGHTIYLEDGNEAWNSGAGGNLAQGVGPSYGYTLGVNMAAAKAAPGYNSNVIKLVGDSFGAGAEGYGTLGWIQNAMTTAQAVPNGLPDFVDVAPYLLNFLGNFDTSGSNVSTTGAPFLDIWAEMANIDSVTSPPAYTQSMYLNQQYAKSTFGLGTIVYEVNEATYSGTAATQLQLDQIDASVGNALATTEHVLLMQRDSKVTGPIHVFTLAEPYTGYGCSGCSGNPVMPLWGANLLMATGPGQTPGAANVDRPLAVALGVINNAIGANKNLMAVTQSGTPTFSYPGGQYQGGSPSILSNPAVPYVNCFAYNDGQKNWTTICFNNHLTTAQSITLAGAGAPTGTVSQTIFPNPSNVITDNNENIYLGGPSLTPVVATPSATTASGTTYSIPPASFIALSYSVSGLPILATPTFSPAAGTYPSTQTVTISLPAGSTGCVGVNSTPTAPTAGTCGAGGTTYTGPITVSTSQTVSALATAANSSNSAVASAAYTINPVLPAPTFTPAAGSYTAAQSVTIGDAVPGTTLYYTTNGTPPTASSNIYTGAITVSTSQTLQAIAVKAGFTTSAVASAAYAISISATPVVTTACYQGSGSNSLTLGPLNTTGANAIAIAVSSFNVIGSITDNLGNGNAIGLTGTGSSPANQIFYWQTPNVSNAHTFTVNGNGGLYASACVYVMSGITGVYSGAQNAASMGYGSTSCQTGITPSSGPQVVIAGFGVYSPGGVPSIDSSYTLGAYQPGVAGSAFGEAAAYTFQPAGAITSPKWLWSNGATTPSCVIAAFGGGAGSPTAATPTFSLAAGTYTSAQSVTIGDATVGSAIYYTTNGTIPTTSSSVYSGPIPVSTTQTLRAIAVQSGYTNSAIASITYTINPVLPGPTFSPAGGSYATAQAVTIGDATAGTTIYYTTNGTTPTTSSNVYSGPIAVSTSQTIQAIAFETGYTTSAATSASYVLNLTLPAPTFSPGSGAYTSAPSSTGATYGLHLHGDSNTQPLGAGCSAASLCYDMLLNAEIGPNTAANTNDASSGDEAEDMNVKVFTNENPIASNNPIQTTLIGTNDAILVGAAPGYLTAFAQLQASTHAWLALANTDKIPGSAAAVAGTCSNDTTYPTITGKQCTVSNSTVTWSNVSAPNGKIYLWYRAFETSQGTATCTVDGASATDTLTSSTLLKAQALVGLPSGHSIRDDVQLARFAGYSTTAPHTVACTNTNTFSYIGLGLPPGTRYPAFFAPKVAMGGVLYVQNDANSAVTAAYHSQSATIAALLYGDNLNVLWFDNRQYADAFCDMGADPHTPQCPESNSAPYHPSDVGHRHLANGFEDTLHISASAAPLTVAISDAVGGTSIYYTTNGSTPTTSSNLYSGPIKVLTSETIQAFAVEAGYSNSPVATAVYTIDNSAALPAPTFSPAAGSYTTTQSVSITDATAGTTIYFTTNGTTPTTSSSVYTSPINVASSQTLQAIAIAAGYTTSPAASAAYTINTPALPTPTFSPAGGTYTATQSVTITDATPGTTIYFTTNGSTPTTSSNIYSGPVTISTSQTLQAIAAASGYTNSPVASAAYTINTPALPTPTFSPAGGTYTTTQSVTITDATPGTTIYFTTNGSTPTTSSNIYSGPVTISTSQTLQAIAVAAGYTNSPVASAAYNINPILPTPTFSPAGGTYTTTQSVTISDATPGTTIYYTANGTTPTTSSTLYTSPVTISTSQTLQAIAIKSGNTNSPVASAAYTINPILPTPTFSLPGGTYTGAQSISLNDTVAGTTIYYTTNGSTPTTSSSIYGGSINVAASQTIQAIAAKAGYTTSAVGSAAYTINVAPPPPTVATACYQGSSSSTLTLGPLNTTGASTIALVVASFDVISSVTDNLGNGKAIGLTPASGNSPNNQIFYWQAPTVGSGHTITVNGNSGLYGSACVFIMSGVSGVYSGAQSAATTGYGSSSCQAGSITPSSGPQVIIAGFGTYGATSAPAIDSSFTLGAYQPGTPGSSYGEAAGYLLQASAATTNPRWNWPNNATTPGCVVAAFGGGTGTTTPTAAAPTFSPAGGTYTATQSVTITDATPGTTIYYTTNGTTPTTSSNIYTSPITVASSQTLQAIAAASGYTTSPAASAAYTINPILPAPTFSPAGGTYTGSQSVTISDATSGTTIYFTTNGTTPNTSSTIYTSPITVSTTQTLQAIAAASGYNTSPAASAAYTINPILPAPTFSPAGGTYTATQSVTITDATPGTTIYYTTNGTTPTTSSNIYTSPITVASSQTLQAIAAASGYNTSPAASAAYTINPILPAPTFSPAGGTYTATQSVTITDATPGTTIYYTTNGTTPTTSSNIYTSPITVSTTQTLQAIAAASGYNTSPAASAAYTINTPVLPTPTFSPAGGTYTGSQSVTISDATSGTTIYYTTNGATPTTTSTLYTGPINVASSQTIQAIAVATGYTNSPAASAAYTINTPVLPAPTFSPAGGTYTATQSVTITDTTPGTTIYYTTNGSTPTTSSSIYSGPITVSSSQTLQAIAAKSGSTNSPVASAAYTISIVSSGPTVATACYQGSSASSLTLGPLNTIGATAIAIAVSSFDALSSVTDNMGNGRATGLNGSGGSPHNQIFYWQAPTVGSGHTITVNGNSGLYASACVFIISGVSGVYSGAQNVTSAGYGSPTCQTGITPSSGPQVVIAAFGVYGPTGAPTIGSSYTLGSYQSGAPGSAFAEATAYLIQPAGAATSPIWNWPTTAATPTCAIAAFGGGPPSTP